MTAHEVSSFLAKPIGEMLRERGHLSEKDLTKGLAVQQEIGGLLGQALHRIGAVTEESLIQCLSDQLGLSVITTAGLPADRRDFLSAAERLSLPPAWFLAHRAVVWIEKPPDGEVGQETVIIVSSDPLCASLREGVEAGLQRAGLGRDGTIHQSLRYHLADNQTIDICLSRFIDEETSDEDDEFSDTSRLRELAEEAPVIDYVNNLFTGALRENASDIHIEAYEPVAVVRYRVDGVLHERAKFGRGRFDAVASRIKLIAGMDIAERRLPQDGRCTVRFAGNEVDLRVSSVPSTWGESLVIRLLRKQTELPDLAGLGLVGRTSDVLQRLLSQPNGVFLVTGPTGSGKSTTLYRGLEHINDGHRKIITIEDPVEYDISGITQIQVKPEIGYDFANGLRAILRQDPDVIMIGEIRDKETATIAAQAALTGHVVLSTLHTNSALAAVTRLKDIGLESFLIAASVRGLMAQRLVRKLCKNCCQPAVNTEGDRYVEKAVQMSRGAFQLEALSANWHAQVGCEQCADTGYHGRIALSEIVEIDDAMREAISDEAPPSTLLEIAHKQGFETLFETGLRKARLGETTLSEVLRVCSGDYV